MCAGVIYLVLWIFLVMDWFFLMLCFVKVVGTFVRQLRVVLMLSVSSLCV